MINKRAAVSLHRRTLLFLAQQASNKPDSSMSPRCDSLVLVPRTGRDLEFHPFVASLHDDFHRLPDLESLDGERVVVDILDLSTSQFHDHISSTDSSLFRWPVLGDGR